MSVEKIKDKKNVEVSEVKPDDVCEVREEKTKEFLAEEYKNLQENDTENKKLQQYASKEEYADAQHKEYLKDEIKNKFNEDAIEIKKAKLEIRELTEELESSNTMTEYWREKWRQDRIDHVTGLEIRKALFEKMRAKISKIYGFDEKTSHAQIFEMLVKKSPKDFGQKDFSVMMADVSFLSLVNEAGHEQGDNLLKKIGEEVKKEVRDSYRHGGDEITGFFDENSGVFDIGSDDFQKKIKQMRESIKKLPIDKINQYKLHPNLDVGVASFDEALAVFRELAKNPEASSELKNNPIKKLENILVAIADKRSFIEKGKERISLLADKYNDRDLYKSIIPALRKGGHGISDKDIKKIANIAQGSIPQRILRFIKKLGAGEEYKPKGEEKRQIDKSLQAAIAKFIQEKEKVELEKLANAEDNYPYREARAIMKIVEI